jgi:hypothetical protein
MYCVRDILSNDEVLSDAFELKEIDGAVFEVDCKWVTAEENLNDLQGTHATLLWRIG